MSPAVFRQLTLILLAVAAVSAFPAGAAAQAPVPLPGTVLDPQVPAPGAVTGGVSGVSQTSATVAATVDPNGAATVYTFQYGVTSLDRQTTTRSAGSGSAAVPVTAKLDGLKPDTRYVYRVVAQSEGGVVAGAPREFRTDKTPLPAAAATGAATRVAETTATLTGSINGRGRTGTFIFQYGPTTKYGASTPIQTLTTSTKAVAVSAPVDKLAPDTTYHYRLLAKVGGKLVGGADRTFTTAKVANGLLVKARPAPVLFGRSTEITGQLVGSQNTGVPVALQVDTFPLDNGWTTVSTAKTDASGAYAMKLSPMLVTSRVRVVAGTTPAVISLPVTVGVRVRTSMHVSRTHVRRGQRVRFYGSVRPAQSGATISIKRKIRGHYRLIARTRQHGSHYSRRLKLRHSGRYRVIAKTVDGSHVMGKSRSRFIRVR